MEIILAMSSGQETRASIIKTLRINSMIFEKYINSLEKKGIVKQKGDSYFELTEKGKNIAIKIKKLYEISQSINFIEEEVRRYLEMTDSEELKGSNRTA
ncbi:hypothetical protein IC006_2530 [Sulfuracidifex tepidarius]|uniref:ArnR1-like winged helix-turn-helix domain-containing protein n=2 Tax=Sulfuracidifex tepidarius TaxID=1294262 RepID=A0A510DYA6_9CREN|nr:hypothetical protein IC006_2530 [Sulfuracidifex tepidarius]BBG27988.1 hypothetical protein IC007_2543 [Sulfuracidifex tepidarius]